MKKTILIILSLTFIAGCTDSEKAALFADTGEQKVVVGESDVDGADSELLAQDDYTGTEDFRVDDNLSENSGALNGAVKKNKLAESNNADGNNIEGDNDIDKNKKLEGDNGNAIDSNAIKKGSDLNDSGLIDINFKFKKEYHTFNVDQKLLDEPEMHLTLESNSIEDLILTNENFNVYQFEESRDQMVRFLNEYNEMLLKIHNDFVDNRKKTYREFEDYYKDYNDEIIKVESRLDIVCDQDHDSFNKDTCENLTIHKNTIMESYFDTKDILFELIHKMDRDEKNILRNYEERKNEQIERAID